MAVEDQQSAESPSLRRRWWFWSLILLVVILATPVIYKWWWRTTLGLAIEAHALSDEGKHDEAIALLNRAIWFSPDSDVRNGSYGVRASYYAKAGDFDQAIADLDLAVAFSRKEGNFQYVPDLIMRGIYQREVGRIDSAVSDFDAALQAIEYMDEVWRQRHTHFAAMAHHHRGLAHQQAGRNNDAANDFRAAGELDPEWVARASGTIGGQPE